MASGCVPEVEECGQDQDGRSIKIRFIADLSLGWYIGWVIEYL